MQREAIAVAIGARVKRARTDAKLSRRALAELACVSERYLSQLENGEANVSIGILVRLSQALDVAFLDLIRDDSPTPETSQVSRLLLRLSPREQAAAVAYLKRYLRDRQGNLRGVALLGLRGAGKSTLGGLLAARFGLPCLSITREIEARAGMSVNELFNLGGADAYRLHENEVVAEIARRSDRIVLETAGGIVGNGPALDMILQSFKTVWLRATPKEHLQRVASQGDTRPMRGTPQALEHLKALLAQREPEYARAEHVLVTTDRTIDDCLTELEQISSPILSPLAAD